MLPDASLADALKGGLALGTSGAALGLAAHSALLTAGLALLRPVTLATAAAFGLGVSAACRKPALPPAPSPRQSPAGPQHRGPRRPARGQHRRRPARRRRGARAFLPGRHWRGDRRRRGRERQRIPLAPPGPPRQPPSWPAAWPWPTTWLGTGRRETVMLGIAAGSLADRTVLQLLAHAFQAAAAARPASARAHPRRLPTAARPSSASPPPGTPASACTSTCRRATSRPCAAASSCRWAASRSRPACSTAWRPRRRPHRPPRQPRGPGPRAGGGERRHRGARRPQPAPLPQPLRPRPLVRAPGGPRRLTRAAGP